MQLSTPRGAVFAAGSPILDGHAGTVHVGLRDDLLRAELARTNRTVLLGLLFCLAIGVLLAFALTYAITRPIRNLVEVAHRLGDEAYDARAHVYSDDEIGRLAVAFNRMAAGLQRIRREVIDHEQERVALLDRLVDSQEEERKRLSRELHDDIGQSVLALMLMLEADHDADTKVSGRLAAAKAHVTGLMDDVRHLAWTMRPSVLDDYGLDSALKRYVQELAARSAIVFDYEYTAPPDAPRLDARVEITLYRIAQEALSNVVRHASATRASLVVLQRPDAVTLLVEDDGVGIPTPDNAPPDHERGLGIAGMRERAALLSGTCDIESEPGAGTTVRVRIPRDAP